MVDVFDNWQFGDLCRFPPSPHAERIADLVGLFRLLQFVHHSFFSILLKPGSLISISDESLSFFHARRDRESWVAVVSRERTSENWEQRFSELAPKLSFVAIEIV
jgi:hypothetical protein